MSEFIDGGFSKLDFIQHKAFWAKAHVDTNLFNAKDELTQKNYKAFLCEKYINPTAAGIAMQDIRGQKPILADSYYKNNVAKIEQEPGIKDLAKAIKDKCKRIYPKTNKVRDLLIEHNRFKLNGVTPKADFLEKLIIRLKALLKK